MKRRTSLTAVSTLGIGGLSGCLSKYWDSRTTPSHELYVVNKSAGTQTVTVIVTGQNDEQLFSYEYHLNSQKADESKEFSGNPKSVTVRVKGGTERTFDYRPNVDCRSDANVIGIGIQSKTTVELFYQCG